MDIGTLSLRDAAVEYARRGWRVLPVTPRGKVPILQDWPNRASSNPEEVAAWWDANPEANIGIACGDIVVIDVDGEVGEDSLACIQIDNEILPETLECRTGTGRHLYYSQTGDLGNSASNLAEHLDTRGKGGFVVAPPSIHPNGAEYAWINDGEQLAALPGWVVDKLREPPPAVFTGESFTLQTPKIATSDRTKVRGYLDQWANEVRSTGQGTRNKTLNDKACRAGNFIAGGYLETDEVLSKLLAAALDAGLEQKESIKTIESGLKRGLRDPRFLPNAHPDPPKVQLERKSRGQFSVKRVSEYHKEPDIETFWDGRLARGYLTVLAGNGGIGKSTITGWLCSALTNGEDCALLGWKDSPVRGDVLLISYEDSGKLIMKRNEVLGANNDRVFVLEGRKIFDADGNEMAAPITVEDIEFLDIEIRDEFPDLAMLVVDPWKSLVMDINRPEIVNPVTAALQALAKRRNIAVLVVAHWNSQGRVAGYRGLHDTARSVMECKIVESRPDATRVAVMHTKHNLTPEAPVLLYEFRKLQEVDGVKPGWFSGDNPFEWVEESTSTAEFFMKESEQTGQDKAEIWLRQMLMGEDRPANEVESLALEDGLKTMTLRSAVRSVVREYVEEGVLMWGIA